MGNCQDIPNDGSKKSVSRSKGKAQLVVKTYTWPRDSHGLFDYEGKNLLKKKIKTHHSGTLMRNGDDIRVAKDNEKTQHPEEKELIKLMTKDGDFWVTSCQEPGSDKVNKENANLDENRENLDNDLWLVVKSIKANNNKGYHLSEGDLIKLGRIKYRIKEVQGSPIVPSQKPIKTEVGNDPSLDASINNLNDSIKSVPTNGAHTCRICLSESSEPGNPLVSPCHCSGTMKYVHIKCLQRWLKSKLHIKESGQAVSVFWKSLECELCKASFPNTFQVKDHKYDIIEIDRPNCAYLMMEVLVKDKSMARGVHIIKMENKTNIRLGRGHDSDIRITDISVSRCHALIKLEKGKFYLEDNNSKFGTLVNMKKSFPVAGTYNNISLQIGRTLIYLSMKKNKSILPVCFSHARNAESSNDEANSDVDDKLETEHNLPTRNSHIISANRDSHILGDNEDNIPIENIVEQNLPAGREGQISVDGINIPNT
jgi:hypothetical protein